MSASVSSPATTPTPSESANNGDAALRFSVHLGLVCTSFLAVVLLLLGRRRHDYRRKPFSAGKSDRNKAGYAPVGLHDVEDQSCRPNAASGPEEQLPPIDLEEAAPTSPDAEPSPASFGAQQKSLRAAYKAQQLRNQKFSRLKRDYLAAYLLAMYADWLQGPYNGVLFICGFGSSALLGTVIAGYADKFGRKRFCILYCFVYVFSCFTKHVNWFYVLCFGRLLAGVATSLLFSVFESWVVCAVTQLDGGREDEGANHEEDDADGGELQQQESSRVQEQLSDLFSTAIFGNSLCAIFAGFSAQWVSEGGGEFRRVFDAVVVWGASGVDVLAGTAAEEGGGRGQPTSAARSFGNMLANDAFVYVGKFLGPFDLAACVLVLSSSQNEISRAWRVLKTCPDIQKLGWTCALFESSMFIFVFLWTPALHEIAPTASKPPYGLIFALFMLACMCGSLLFSLLQSSKTEKELAGILLSVAIVSNAVVVCTNNTFLLLLGFLGFELSLGLYFPVFGLLKSRLVPERSRAMLYNFFRVPLNLIVVGSLAVDIPVRVGFLLITGMLLLCAVLLRFSDYETNSSNRNKGAHKTETSDGSDDDDGNPTDFLVFGGYSPRNNSSANLAAQNQKQIDAEKSDTSARRAPQLVGVATAARPGVAAQKAGSASASLFGSRTRADGAAQKARLEQYLRALEADSSDADGGI
eukprot:g6624.t1